MFHLSLKGRLGSETHTAYASSEPAPELEACAWGKGQVGFSWKVLAGFSLYQHIYVSPLGTMPHSHAVSDVCGMHTRVHMKGW